MVPLKKSDLRKEIRERKRRLTPAQIETASRALAGQLFAHPFYRQARSLYGYLSYNQEVLTLPILRRAQRDGKRVAVPKVFGDTMRFLWLDDLGRIACGYRGIPEPMDSDPVADDPTALVLMPGLAFDASGRRLGYGGGFYDRFLALEPHPTIALCYDFQFFPELPAQPHDIPVDIVLHCPIQEEQP